MKLKRNDCYIAMRDLIGPLGEIKSTVACGVFAFFEDCESKCGEWEQEAREKGLNVVFRPFLTTFYG